MSTEELTLDEYQTKAMTTCMDSSKNISYMLLNLVGEVGEFSSKIAKGIRKGQLSINHNNLKLDVMPTIAIIEEMESGLKEELGDILWQLSGICSVMELKLSDIAAINLNKLSSRKERNVIDGDGDNR